jgi:SAM-dependent methyltransferase
MGMDVNAVRFLISAYKSGVRFERAVTLGRLTLFVDEKTLPGLRNELLQAAPNPSLDLEAYGVADGVLSALGAKQVDAIDKLDFEGASVLHDMNLPLSDQYKEQFDLVYDGGTLEHIFNFPTAIQNAMELVKVGGHLAIQTPTNNWSGHGFYQFSPELYFRVLSEQNGFRIKRMVIFEWGVNKWYEVSDPATVQSRVYVTNNSRRVSLMILAERVARVPINQTPPQQSDYVMQKWTTGSASAPAKPAIAKPKMTPKAALSKLLLPLLLVQKAMKKQLFGEERDFFMKNQQHFTPVDR